MRGADKKVMKNAIAYIKRKKNRTFILFVILTIVLSCLYACLSIIKSSHNIEDSLYELSNSSLSITKNDGSYFNIHPFKDIEKISEINETTIQYNGLANPIDVSVVEGEQKIVREHLPDEFRNVLALEATNYTRRNILFHSGVFTMIEGRHIEEDDKNTILVHEDFAEKNNLSLNDEISLELPEMENNKQNREFKFKIIGIFSGKKQETYTGLSSDFSENNVFIDYATSQESLNKSDDTKVANEILIFVNNPESTDFVLKKIKELKIDWSMYSIEQDNNAFEDSLESISGIKHTIKIMTYLIMLGGIIVLSLILSLWLRERIYEIGILLSIGITKIQIMFQFIIELIFISLPAMVSSLLLGNLFVRQIIDGYISSDTPANVGNSLFNEKSMLLSLETLGQSYLILISIFILSVIVASSMILVKKPKEILSKIS